MLNWAALSGIKKQNKNKSVTKEKYDHKNESHPVNGQKTQSEVISVELPNPRSPENSVWIKPSLINSVGGRCYRPNNSASASKFCSRGEPSSFSFTCRQEASGQTVCCWVKVPGWSCDVELDQRHTSWTNSRVRNWTGIWRYDTDETLRLDDWWCCCPCQMKPFQVVKIYSHGKWLP